MKIRHRVIARLLLSIALLLIPFHTGQAIYAAEEAPVYVELMVAHRYQSTEEGMVLQYSLNLRNLADRPAKNLVLTVKHTGGEAHFYPEMSVNGWRCDFTEVIGESCNWEVEEIPGKVTLGLTFALLLDDSASVAPRRTTHVIIKTPSADGRTLSEYLHVDLIVPFRGQSLERYYLPLMMVR